MMGKTLTKILGTGLLAGSLLFGGLKCSTIEEASDAELIRVAGRVISMTADDEDGAIAGAVLEGIGESQVAKEIAREGKTEVNTEVNVYTNKKESVQERERLDKYDLGIEKFGSWISPSLSFTCSNYYDFNKDESIGKDELINLGSYFKYKKENTKNQVICGSLWAFVKGSVVTGKITEKNTNRIIRVDDYIFPTNCDIRFIYLSFHKSEKDYGIKEYTLEWLVNGKLIPSRTINFFVDYGEIENK